MASLLALGGGASEGLDTYLTRLLQEQQVQQKQQQIAEEARSNQAHEALQGRQIDESGLLRQLTLAGQIQNQQNTNADRDAARTLSAIKLRPIGANVTPEEKTGEMAAGASQGNYEFTPASLGKSTPEGDIGPTPDTIKWRGTQEQITAAANAAKEKTGEIRDTATGLQRIGADNQVSPILGPDGKPVQGYHPPQHDANPQPQLIYDKDGKPHMIQFVAGQSREVPLPSGDWSGKTNPITTQDRNRMNSAQLVGSHIPDMLTDIEEADKRGLLGPALGRWSGFMAGHIGSTGNDENDALLGRLYMDMSALKSGFGMVHGGARGGGSPQMAARFDKVLNAQSMSKAELTSAIQEVAKWLDTYAKGSHAATSGAKPSAADLIKKYGG